MKSFYNALGVTQNSSKKDINDAYRKLVLKYHPDRIKDEKLRKEAETKMLEINEAYEVLGNEEKRKEYDLHLRYGTTYSGNDRGYHSNFSEDGNSFFQQFDFGFGDVHNIFKQFFQMETEDFTNTSSNSAPRRKVEVVLTMEEWFSGCVKTINYTRKVECLKCSKQNVRCTICKGSGFVPSLFSKVKCTACAGEGNIKQRISCNVCTLGTQDENSSTKLNIPPFVNSGISISKGGDYFNSSHGGMYGNLEVKFVLTKHDFFEISESNIVAKIDLTLEDFIYGTNINLTYLDGKKINLNVEPYFTEDVYVKGKGIAANGYNRGDLIIVLNYCKTYDVNISKDELKKLFNFKKVEKNIHYTTQSK